MAEKKIIKTKEKLASTSKMLSLAIQTWWKNLDKFIMIYVWGIVYSVLPAAAIVASLGIFSFLEKWSLAYRIGMVIVTAIILVAVFFIIYYFIRAYISLFLLIKNDYKGRSFKTFEESKEYVYPYLVVMGWVSVFTFLWFFVFIIPGFVYSIFYSLAIFAFFFEGIAGRKALKRSVELIKGYWWAVFWRIFFYGIFLSLFTMFFSIPGTLFEAGGVMSSIWGLMSQVVNFLVGPVSLLFSYIMFKELVKIKAKS